MDAEPDPSLKLQPWTVVQEDILKLLRTPAFLDTSIVMTHSPQLLQTMPAGAEMTSMVHFTATTGEVLTGAAKNRKLYVWTLNNTNKKLTTMDPHQSLKAVGEIKCMTYIAQTRTFVGYCSDKTLRVFMDPVTGCEDIAYLTINHALTCIIYNKDTNEVVCGGVGILESYEVDGTEFRTKLKKGKRINVDIQKDEEIRDLKLDTRNKQIMALSDRGINVVNYKSGTHTHVLVNRHSGSLTSCCIYHEGEFLVTGSSEGDLKVWNSVVYTQVHEFPGHIEKVTAICCLPKDPVLFSSSTDGTLYVWRMDTFQKFMKLDIGEKICTMKLLKDGTLLAQTPMEVMTYSLKQFYSTFATANADIVKLSRLKGMGYRSNKLLVSSEDGRLLVYNPLTATLVSTMLPLPKTQVVEEFAYSGIDGKLYIVLRDGNVLVLNTMANPFRPIELLQPPEPQFNITCLTIMTVSFGAGGPHGSMEDIVIFMGSQTGLICVLESQSVIMETAQPAHQGGVVSLQASCDVDAANFCLKKTSRFLLSAGMDNLVKLWGLEFEPGMGGWSLSLALLQNIDCMGSPSHIAMFENIICVAFGEYGLVKMFRLAGLTKGLDSSELQGLYVLLTHFSQFDHSDTIMALDMCPVAGLFVTCSRDGCVKLWDTNNQLVREMAFGQPVNSVCFINDRGDLIIGFQNRILLVTIQKYMLQYYLEKMSSKMFQDDLKENALELNNKKKKLWFDPKTVHKYSTDLVTRMTQKVNLKATLMDDDDLSLERMRSDLSTDSGLGSMSIVDSRPSLTRENTTLSLNDALLREKSNEELSSTGTAREIQSGRAGKRQKKSRARKRQLDLDDKDLRKISIGEALAEEEEEDESLRTSKEMRLAREDSLLYFRKPSIWLHGKELTPSTLRDLEMTANATRIAEALLPEYLRPSTDEVIPITPEPKKGPQYTPEQLKMLTPWERFLLTKKPIIAPDGYIPNSVVRRQIGYISPPSPTFEWFLKPVPESDPRHLPENWKSSRQKSRHGALASPHDADVDIDNIMDMKRANTLQSVKIQQSIKEASLYVGTSMCLLPDGTEPEGVPNFLWRSDREDVADLTPLARPRPEEFTPVKEVSAITPSLTKTTPDKDGSTPKLDVKTPSRPLKKVDIDLTSGLSKDLPGLSRGPPRGLVSKMPAALEMEKSRSFRLSQAVSEDNMLDPPQEEAEKNLSSDGVPSDPSPVPTETSDATKSTVSKATSQKKSKKPTKKEDPKNREKAEARMAKAPAKKRPLAPPSKKLTKEEELTLLQKIVKEEWFPTGVPALLDIVNDELTKLLDTKDFKIFPAVCDYLVQIFQQLSITTKFLNRAADRLSKQLTNPSAIIRKKAAWTMKQLGLQAKKETLSAILPGLLDAKGETQEELINAIGDMLGGGKDGLDKLMTSLGITNSKGITSKEDQQAAIKMISAKLQDDAERLKLGSGDGSKQRIEMWVSSLNLPQEINVLRSGGTNSRPMDSNLGSRGLDTDASFLSDVSSKSGRGSKRRTKTRKRGRKRSVKGGKGESDNESSNEKMDVGSVDMSVQTDPRPDDGQITDEGEDDGSSLGGRRRGRWRRGGMSQFREGGDGTEEEDSATDVDEGYEEATEGAGGKRKGGRRDDKGEKIMIADGPLRTESGQFTVVDFDYTPNMIRSETGGSEWSDELPALTTNTTTPGRPKGASVHKFYERRDHVATVSGQDGASRLHPGGGAFFKMPSIVEPHAKGQMESDLNDQTTDIDSDSAETNRDQRKILDGVSVDDSGICRDFASEVSSQIYPASDSLLDQTRPRLSAIKSHSNLKAKSGDKKEPKWKSFFEAEKVQERRKGQEMARKDKDCLVEEQPEVRIPTLPPIMYLDPEQPTFPGEAGLRLLHSIRLADRDRTQDTSIGHLVEPIPGRLTISTQDQPTGDTNYGLLQMHWTTQVPRLPLDTARTDRRADRRHEADQRNAFTERLQPVSEQPTLPRLYRTETTYQRKQEPVLLLAKEKPLPVLVRKEKTDFQWSKPMAPAPKRASFVHSHTSTHDPHCASYKWAAKKMHHFTFIGKFLNYTARAQRLMDFSVKGYTLSEKITETKCLNEIPRRKWMESKPGVLLPKMEERANTFVTTSAYHNDVMSIINHSSVALVSGMNLEKLFSTMNLSTSS